MAFQLSQCCLLTSSSLPQSLVLEEFIPHLSGLASDFPAALSSCRSPEGQGWWCPCGRVCVLIREQMHVTSCGASLLVVAGVTTPLVPAWSKPLLFLWFCLLSLCCLTCLCFIPSRSCFSLFLAFPPCASCMLLPVLGTPCLPLDWMTERSLGWYLRALVVISPPTFPSFLTACFPFLCFSLGFSLLVALIFPLCRLLVSLVHNNVTCGLSELYRCQERSDPLHTSIFRGCYSFIEWN